MMATGQGGGKAREGCGCRGPSRLGLIPRGTPEQNGAMGLSWLERRGLGFHKAVTVSRWLWALPEGQGDLSSVSGGSGSHRTQGSYPEMGVSCDLPAVPCRWGPQSSKGDLSRESTPAWLPLWWFFLFCLFLASASRFLCSLSNFPSRVNSDRWVPDSWEFTP